MPITITVPSLVIGPQYTLQLKSDFVGPIADGWHYQMTITQEGIESTTQTWIEDPRTFWVPGGTIDFTMSKVFEIGTGIKTQAPCIVEAQLLDNQGRILDQGQTPDPLPWDPIGAQWVAQGQATGQGGLTEQEHVWLDTTQQAVLQAFQTLTGAVLESPIGGLIAHPDPHLMNIFDGCTQITGSGALQLPSAEPAFDSYGVIVTFDVVPVGFGFRQGVSPKYFERIVELAAVYATNDGDHQYLGEVQEFYTSQQLWLWRQFRPLELLYNVTPGCQVSICFLTA